MEGSARRVQSVGDARWEGCKKKTLDLVSYRGRRSIVTVDMSVDSRSTDGRDLGRATVATRSTLGR